MTRAILVLMLCGCTETVELVRDPLENVASIEIFPADARVTVTDLAPPQHTLQYQAMGRLADGSTRDVTALVTWSTNNKLLGDFEGEGLFVASHLAAGRTTIEARAGALTASGALTVAIDTTIVDSAFPPPMANLFDPASLVVTGDPNAPAMTYPVDGTLMPQGLASTLFQYTRGTSDAFQLTFESDVLHLAIETGADRWEADGTMQRLLATTALDGPLRVSVRGTSATAPGTIYAGRAIALAFTADTPHNPLYYWSASTNGIMRGGIAVASASELYPSSNDTCVGCHAISRNGSQMAMASNNGVSFDLQTIDLGTLATVIPPTPARPMGWASYSPEGDRLVVADDGVLTEYDARTGAVIGPVPLPASRYATHPDWSPDGMYLAVALTNQAPNYLDVRGASIARIPHNGGAWGPPEILVTGSSTNNNYFPRWSPDGSQIAFVHATGASEGNESAELALIARAGGAPRPLHVANQGSGNTMPAWGPHSGERAWLAFVSSRPYGSVLAGGRGQIWVTSVDLTRNADSTTSAFWLPCQDVTVLNYAPVWTSEVVTQ